MLRRVTAMSVKWCPSSSPSRSRYQFGTLAGNSTISAKAQPHNSLESRPLDPRSLAAQQRNAHLSIIVFFSSLRFFIICVALAASARMRSMLLFNTRGAWGKPRGRSRWQASCKGSDIQCVVRVEKFCPRIQSSGSTSHEVWIWQHDSEWLAGWKH